MSPTDRWVRSATTPASRRPPSRSGPLRSARWLLVGALALAPMSIATGQPVAEAEPAGAAVADGFVELFNGQDLAGWWGADTEDPRGYLDLPADEFAARREASLANIRQHWRVEDGELVNDGQGLYLTTDQEYGDFELLLDYKTVAEADSGIYLRGCRRSRFGTTTDAAASGIGADKGSGGLWNNADGAPGGPAGAGRPAVRPVEPVSHRDGRRARTGSGSTASSVVDDARLENYFDRDSPLPAAGTDPTADSRRRNPLAERPVPARSTPTEANAWLRGDDAGRFRAGVQRQGLHRLARPGRRNYESRRRDACKSEQGGTICTDARVRRLRRPTGVQAPAGRQQRPGDPLPGRGRHRLRRACANCRSSTTRHPKYAKLDPRQYHGSAYGMAAAHRGYLRPAGEWNFQEVTVAGLDHPVELNGTVSSTPT